MKVRLLVSRSGLDGAFNRGDEIDVPKGEAARMIEAGQAEPVRSAKPQTATKRARPETATK